MFFVLIGGRGCGKTVSSQNYCLKQFFKKGRKFLWLRLKEPSVKALLQNNAADFIDSTLMEKWGITGLKVEGNSVYVTRDINPTKESYKEMCKIMALSTFYIMKGVALNKKGKTTTKDQKLDEATSKAMIKRNLQKYRNIVLDELNQEKSEKKTFDISYAFVNQLETVCRNDLDRRIILCGNTLEEGSDILSNCFNFIPNELGTYYLKNKRAVIDYIDDSADFKKARKNSIAGILAPQASTFTNKIDSDIKLISGKTNEPTTYIIRFDNGKDFAVCGNTITKKKISKQSNVPIIAMKPYLIGVPYYKDRATVVIERAQQRLFTFDMLVTLKQFYSEIKLLKQ